MFAQSSTLESLMRHVGRGLLVTVALLAAGAPSAVVSAQASAAPAYDITDSLVVGHVQGTFYDLDVVNRRLYGAGNTIIDIDQLHVVGHIADSTPGTMYLVAAEAERGLTNTGVVFNASTGAVGEHLPIHGAAIAYDPVMRRAFLLSDTIKVVNLSPPLQSIGMIQRGRMGGGGYGGGMMGNGTIDRRRDTAIRRLPPVRLTATIVGQIPVPAPAASGVADGRGRIYVSIPTKDSIAIIDTDKLKVTGGRPLQSCHAPTGLAIDNAHARLFVSCDSVLTVMSLTDGHTSGQVPAGGHATQLGFEAGTGLLFVPAGPDGVIVVYEQDPEHYVVAQRISDPRVAGASALVVDPTTHRVFVPHLAADGTFSFVVLAPKF